MEEKELTQAIKRYLEDDSDNYAIMVTGPWGCGKTHYVENYLRREAASDVAYRSSFNVRDKL